MAKKSGGGGLGVVLLVGLGLLAAVPKAVWIAVGFIVVVAAAVYFFVKHSDSSSSPAGGQHEGESQPQARRARTSSSNPYVARSRHPQQNEELVPLNFVGGDEPAYKVPRQGTASWIPFGESVTVAGTQIRGGMFYLGASLPSLRGGEDPALICTKKSVANHGDYRERRFGYWPSYSEISPSERRAYLNWLADGRKDPDADIGYVFLYFYGLERRALLDAPKDSAAQDDWPRIAAELKRLLAIYGQNNSFHGYATKLLSWLSVSTYSSKLYLQPLPDYERSWELPLHLRLVLGQCALDQVPVPEHVAFEWARLDPSRYLRTPAIRCAEQFEQLFLQNYRKTFGAGLVLPVNKTKLKLVYQPASAGFQGYSNINLTFGDVPDVTVLTGPSKKLQDLVDVATSGLESYSRYVGRNPTEASSLASLLLLPATLWPKAVLAQMEELKNRTARGMVIMKFDELLSVVGGRGTLTKDKLAALARALESMNLAIEPDVLAGAKGPKLDESVVLFATASGQSAERSAPAYQAAVLTIQLATAVAMADGTFGPEELRQMRTQINGWTHLTPGHQQRLFAHMRLLMDVPVSLATLKKKVEPLDVRSREAIAKFMAVIAQADGIVSPAEIKMLERVYKILGVESAKVFSDVHSAAATQTKLPTTDATIPSTSDAGIRSGFQLDAAKIAALQKDTEQVTALLANIFKEDDVFAQVVPSPAVEEPEESSAPAPAGLAGLDEAHKSFVRLLLSRPNWTREELLDSASDLELMLDGALDRINEASFDVHDSPLTEGEDPITVNLDILEKVPA